MGYYESVKAKFDALKEKKDITVLAIESSCDETAAAVVKNGRQILSNVIASQIEIHRRFGGVVPEVASRNHTAAVGKVTDDALKQAGLRLSDIDLIAVTYGAGLLGALLVGVSYAKGLSYAAEIPLIPVSHIKGHIAANYIACPQLEPPYVCLLASGGHTALLKVEDYDSFTLLGSTQDDAAGEAFDKVARTLGLKYPGGPEIEKLALQGRPVIKFTRPMAKEDTLDFSYSGLKTAVINYVHNRAAKGEEINAADVAASFQKTAVDMLVDNAAAAVRRTKTDTLVIAGGVSANTYLREQADRAAAKYGFRAVYPPLGLCTDNAAMIASAAYFLLRSGESFAGLDLDAKATVPLGQADIT